MPKRDPNPLDTWIREVSGGKNHIPEQLERSLIDTYKNGNEEERADALQELLAYNAASLANICLDVYHSSRGAYNMDIMDLVQQAVITFIGKLNTFNPDKARLITYYTRDVRTTAQRTVASNAYAVRQGSVYLQSIAARMSMARRELEGQMEGEPSDADVADRAGIHPRTAKMAREFTYPVVTSMPTNIGKDELISEQTVLTVLDRKLAHLQPDQFSDLAESLYMGRPLTTEQLRLIKEGNTVGNNRSPEKVST